MAFTDPEKKDINQYLGILSVFDENQTIAEMYGDALTELFKQAFGYSQEEADDAVDSFWDLCSGQQSPTDPNTYKDCGFAEVQIEYDKLDQAGKDSVWSVINTAIGA
jgi:hypothetical protein